jgi:hypothetical protein
VPCRLLCLFVLNIVKPLISLTTLLYCKRVVLFAHTHFKKYIVHTLIISVRSMYLDPIYMSPALLINVYKYHFPLRNRNSWKYLIFLEKFVGWPLLCGDQPMCLLNRPTEEEKKQEERMGSGGTQWVKKKGMAFRTTTSVILEDRLWSDLYKILLCCSWRRGLRID